MSRGRMQSGMVVVAFLMVGCATSLPDGYVPLETWDESVEQTGVSSHGNRFEVRRHANPEGGTLEFWAEAVRRELVDARGYEQRERRNVRTKGGDDGVEFHFTVTRALETYDYLVAVFVDGDEVLVAEAGGESASLTNDLDVLRDAIRNLDP